MIYNKNDNSRIGTNRKKPYGISIAYKIFNKIYSLDFSPSSFILWPAQGMRDRKRESRIMTERENTFFVAKYCINSYTIQTAIP